MSLRVAPGHATKPHARPHLMVSLLTSVVDWIRIVFNVNCNFWQKNVKTFQLYIVFRFLVINTLDLDPDSYPHWQKMLDSDPDPDPGFWRPEIEKESTAENFLTIFWSEIAIYLFLGLHKGRPSYRKSLLPTKDNIQHFKTWNFFTFVSNYCPPGSVSGTSRPKWMRIYTVTDPDPQHCMLFTLIHDNLFLYNVHYERNYRATCPRDICIK